MCGRGGVRFGKGARKATVLSAEKQDGTFGFDGIQLTDGGGARLASLSTIFYTDLK